MFAFQDFSFVKQVQRRKYQHTIHTVHFLPSQYLMIIIIEGLRAKWGYIAFLADFHFLQDQANFWQTDLF